MKKAFKATLNGIKCRKKSLKWQLADYIMCACLFSNCCGNKENTLEENFEEKMEIENEKGNHSNASIQSLELSMNKKNCLKFPTTVFETMTAEKDIQSTNEGATTIFTGVNNNNNNNTVKTAEPTNIPNLEVINEQLLLKIQKVMERKRQHYFQGLKMEFARRNYQLTHPILYGQLTHNVSIQNPFIEEKPKAIKQELKQPIFMFYELPQTKIYKQLLHKRVCNLKPFFESLKQFFTNIDDKPILAIEFKPIDDDKPTIELYIEEEEKTIEIYIPEEEQPSWWPKQTLSIGYEEPPPTVELYIEEEELTVVLDIEEKEQPSWWPKQILSIGYEEPQPIVEFYIEEEKPTVEIDIPEEEQPSWWPKQTLSIGYEQKSKIHQSQPEENLFDAITHLIDMEDVIDDDDDEEEEEHEESNEGMVILNEEFLMEANDDLSYDSYNVPTCFLFDDKEEQKSFIEYKADPLPTDDASFAPKPFDKYKANEMKQIIENNPNDVYQLEPLMIEHMDNEKLFEQPIFYEGQNEMSNTRVDRILTKLQVGQAFHEELLRLNVPSNALTIINQQYQFENAAIYHAYCFTYPKFFAIPTIPGITDSIKGINTLLENAKEGRKLGRIPAFSYYNPVSGAYLYRSSAPTTRGIETMDSPLLKAISQNNQKIHILDCRPSTGATINGTWEPSNKTHSVRYYGIHDRQTVTHAYTETNKDKYNETVGTSLLTWGHSWVTSASSVFSSYGSLRDNYLNTLISTAEEGARRIAKGQSVLVHCTDGRNRTPQVVSLIKFILDPYYRTPYGFAKLVEQEWVGFGHPFAISTGYVGKEASPVFLQFLEAIITIRKRMLPNEDESYFISKLHKLAHIAYFEHCQHFLKASSLIKFNKDFQTKRKNFKLFMSTMQSGFMEYSARMEQLLKIMMGDLYHHTKVQK